MVRVCADSCVVKNFAVTGYRDIDIHCVLKVYADKDNRGPLPPITIIPGIFIPVSGLCGAIRT